MPTTVLRTDEVYDFSVLPYPLTLQNQNNSSYQSFLRNEHSHAGILEYRNLVLPLMHISDMCWTTSRHIKLENTIPMDTVNFVFHLRGENLIHYRQLKKTFEVNGAGHYFMHTPGDSFYNEVYAGEARDVFHISLDKNFFLEMIKGDSRWSDTLQNAFTSGKGFGAPRLLPVTGRMYQLISAIRSGKVSGLVPGLQMQAMALELIAGQFEMIQEMEEPQPGALKTDDIRKLNQLKEYLDTHFLDEMSLLQLSRLSLLNEFKLKKGFKMLHGTTVFGYIRDLRMKHAASLLRQSMPVSEVAFTLGYEHAHHFSVAFRNYTGMNPSAFKC